jgi:predicted  nucleic acid-binding Zn-ribbon protein
MKNVIEILVELQNIEMGPSPDSTANKTEVKRLKQSIPAQILAHYDRLLVRGKKGVALVKHGVCSECHMALASGTHAQLLRAEDIVICGSCGRYLWAISEEPAAPPVAPASAKNGKTAPKKRRKKTGTIPTAEP